MKKDEYRLTDYINQGLVGRTITLEVTSDHNSEVKAVITEVHLQGDTLSISTKDAVRRQFNENRYSLFDCNRFTGSISGITESSVTDDGRITFYNWGGYDSIVIHPPSRK